MSLPLQLSKILANLFQYIILLFYIHGPFKNNNILFKWTFKLSSYFNLLLFNRDGLFNYLVILICYCLTEMDFSII